MPPGRPKGIPKTGGRKPGSPNKTTVAVKEALIQAFNELGGWESLAKWGKENPNNFYPLWIKLLPTEITGPAGKPVELRIVEHIVDGNDNEDDSPSPDSTAVPQV